jgi:hypothetical protein
MKLKLILLLAFVLFSPSLFNYFSHDDFFILRLAKINSIADFFTFFNLFFAPERLGSYRPLTTQVYFLVSHLFNLSPLPLHIIAYLVFFADIYLVYFLTKLLIRSENGSLLSTFLYATSATHFAHLYWPALFQELGLIFFFLLSTIFFLKNKFVFSFFALIGGLMSKETAIVIPIILGLTIIYERSWSKIKFLIPNILLVAAFLFIHIVFYGLPPGEVYKLDFSPKIFNTLMWYALWSFNLPELFVDFIGPGISLNPNLLNFYGKETIAIVALFLITISLGFFALLRQKRVNLNVVIFCAGWFLATLTPIIFLPWHKFTYGLGVPLVGLTIFLGLLFSKLTKLTNKTTRVILSIFCLVWFLTSVATLYLTYKTHWIITGAKVAKRVQKYFHNYQGQQKIVFYDNPEDKVLPWSPANEVKINLSNQDFFEVYYPEKYKVYYLPQLPENPDPETTYIPARQFLGY